MPRKAREKKFLHKYCLNESFHVKKKTIQPEVSPRSHSFVDYQNLSKFKKVTNGDR